MPARSGTEWDGQVLRHRVQQTWIQIPGCCPVALTWIKLTFTCLSFLACKMGVRERLVLPSWEGDVKCLALDCQHTSLAVFIMKIPGSCHL